MKKRLTCVILALVMAMSLLPAGVMEHDETTGISPEAAGAYVAHRALQKNPPPVSVIGGKYALAVFATRFLSNRFLNKAVGDIYAK